MVCNIKNNKRIYSAEELLPLIKDTVSKGCAFPLTITGTSMTPTLYPIRDSVNLVSPELKAPKKYDIVLFKRKNGKLVLHRIKKILKNNKLLINGDCQKWTEVIDKSQIIAVVKSYKQNGKIKSCSSTGVRLYSALWCKTRPFRPVIFKLAKALKH